MTMILTEQTEISLAGARIEGDDLWLPANEAQRATGWTLKPEGFCKGDICIPVPPQRAGEFSAGTDINVAALWRHIDLPLAHDTTGEIWVLGTSASAKSDQLRALEAPDFSLPDLAGVQHSLKEQLGRKVLLVSWASWLGCRADLPVWQKLFTDLAGHNFRVLAVAFDEPEAARPWIKAASPTYPCLIDRNHTVAGLYHMVNVPQAAWIDETGRIVRPPENAGQSDSFRSMDRATGQMTAEQVTERARIKSVYVEAIRDWVLNGAQSEHAFSPDAARAHLRLPDAAAAQGHVHFRLAQHLKLAGRDEEAAQHFSEASRLHPTSWTIFRQAAPKSDSGTASGPDFWARVDALGDKAYHLPIDMKGIQPT